MSAVCTFHVSVGTTPSFRNSHGVAKNNFNERFQQPIHADICEWMETNPSVHVISPLETKHANSDATTQQPADLRYDMHRIHAADLR